MLQEMKAETGRRSQLEIQLNILEVLAYNGPLKLTHVMQKANVNCSLLRKYLDFLAKQGLVEIRNIGKERKVYAITQLGMTVLKQFRELRTMLQLNRETENEARNLSSLKSKN